MVATSRLPAPLAETFAPAAPTRASTLLGVSARRRAAGWIKWAAAGTLMVVAAALLVSRRSRIDDSDAALLVETRAVQPSLPAAVPAAAPAVAPAAVAPAVVAPAGVPPAAVGAPIPAIVVAPVAAGGSTHEADAATGTGGSAASERQRTVTPALPKSASSARSGASRGKPRAPVAPPAREPSPRVDPPDSKPASAPAAPTKIEPSSRGDDPGGKPRPDWGY